MRELVIVVSDLYLSPEAAGRPLPPGVALPGLQHIARFGSRLTVEGGWRPWLARWLVGSRALVASAAPATVAAFALPGSGETGAPGSMVWLASPVHLVAGMSSVHLDIGGVLRLSVEDQVSLSGEFRRTFHDSGFALQELDSGDFLLLGPQLPTGEAAEPARFLGESVVDVRKGPASDPALRRLGAEIEMWLHEHPVNTARIRRGEAPVTGLWLWGGGAVPAVVAPAASQPPVDIAFGRDAYLRGLWASIGQKILPLPQQLADVFGYPDAQRAVLVIETGAMLHAAPSWTLIDALAHLDHAFLSPAVKAVQSGKLERVLLLANDRALTLHRRDHRKFWRRAPTSLSGLQ